MFRAETGEPIHTEGFYDFFGDHAAPLLAAHHEASNGEARPTAFHLVAPSLSPGDIQLMDDMNEGRISVAEYAKDNGYLERITEMRNHGCATDCLQVTLGVRGEAPLDDPIITWQRNLGEAYRDIAGEGCKVTWWGEQYRPMEAALAQDEGPELQVEFEAGIMLDVPVGGYWTIYENEAMQKPLLVAEVMYERDESGVQFKGFDVYDPAQLTPGTLRYMRFWRDVHHSPSENMTLHEVTPIP